MSQKRVQNTKYLNMLGSYAPASEKHKVNKLIHLYSEGKISQRRTAEKLIFNLINPDKRILTKGLKQYDKSIEIFEQSQPLNKRLETKQREKIETIKRDKASSQIGKFVRKIQHSK